MHFALLRSHAVAGRQCRNETMWRSRKEEETLDHTEDDDVRGIGLDLRTGIRSDLIPQDEIAG